ncbi:MAG TPA: VRR-NUC domain-containing protein [Roseiflexaceae bacterium]|nr:VRR-NUC domain-containing protein [Roseiflexaceae bacterium]
MTIHLAPDHPASRAALAQAEATSANQHESKRGRSKQSHTNDAQALKTPPVKPQGKRRGSGPEQAIQNAILAYLHARGILAWRINSGAVKAAHGGLIKLAPKGHSDIFALYQAKAVFIEVKRQGGKVSPDQQAFLDRVRSAGAIAFVARSIDDVEEQLGESS